MQTIEAKSEQSLFDLAIEHTGGIEGVFDLIRLNNLNGATYNSLPGDELKIGNVSDSRKRDYFKQFSPIATIKENERASGIGFWRIGKTLNVT